MAQQQRDVGTVQPAAQRAAGAVAPGSSSGGSPGGSLGGSLGGSATAGDAGVGVEASALDARPESQGERLAVAALYGMGALTVLLALIGLLGGSPG